MDGSANAHGDSCEGAVAGVFWDIFDQLDDDYSGAIDWRVSQLLHHPDGISDSLSDGIDNILDVLLNHTVNGHHPDNLDEFWEAWFEHNNALGHKQAMRDIWYEHGVAKSCCVGIRGNVDNDPQEMIDISDMTYLTNYMFKYGPEPACLEEANINGSGGIDISDHTYLSIYMFKNGPPPPACP